MLGNEFIAWNWHTEAAAEAVNGMPLAFVGALLLLVERATRVVLEAAAWAAFQEWPDEHLVLETGWRGTEAHFAGTPDALNNTGSL